MRGLVHKCSIPANGYQKLLHLVTTWHLVTRKMTWFKLPESKQVIEELDNLVVQDKKLEAVRHVARQVGRSQGHMLDVRRCKDRDLVMEVAKAYPGVFAIQDADPYGDVAVHCVEFTPEMEKLYKDEIETMKARDELISVNILRKLLMMSSNQQLLLTKLGLVQQDFGLPKDFATRLIPQYKKYFRVFENPKGHILQLVKWDQNLAVTTREKTILWRAYLPKTAFHLVKYPTTPEYERFQEHDFPSPYEPFTRRYSPEMCEKRHVAVFHELLSFVPGKRVGLPTLCAFQTEMQLPRDPLWYILRHPGIFYVSRVVDPPVVFLREAFFHDELKFRGPEDIIQDRYLILMQRKPVESIEHTW